MLPPEQSFGNNLRHVNRLIQRDLGVRIASLGLSIGQWYALRTLWHCDDLTQIELAQKSGVAGPAMVIAVRSLLSMGLVARQRHPSDQRKYVISLTEKGRSLETPALQAALDANNAALTGVPPEDIAVCMRVLDKALVNLLANGISMETVAEVDALIE